MRDLTGEKFGKLTVLGQNDYEIRGYTSWRCRCDCGEERVVVGVALRTGKRKSCGCGWREEASMREVEGYDSWKRMVRNCKGKYAGTDITCCDRWMDDFWAFIEDMGPKPPGTQFKRINCRLGFTKENCYWAVPEEVRKQSQENASSGYSAWRRMTGGCSPGGRWHKSGISCCQRWMDSFEAFIEDMGPKPDPKAYLRRYDYEKDYCPENCYWEPFDSVAERKGLNEEIDTPTGKMSVLQFAESIDRAAGTVLGLLRKEYTPEQIISGEADEEEKAKRKAAREEKKQLQLAEDCDCYDNWLGEVPK